MKGLKYLLALGGMIAANASRVEAQSSVILYLQNEVMTDVLPDSVVYFVATNTTWSVASWYSIMAQGDFITEQRSQPKLSGVSR